MSHSPENITALLRAASSGDRRDLDALMTAVYDDMRRLAASHMVKERRDHTLHPTALVHDAYVKLIDQKNTDWKDRLHFFAVASRIIRRILIDHARAHQALKRNSGRTRVCVYEQDIASPERTIDLLDLDEALLELAAIDERQAKIVELRYFGGCSVEEVAELLNTSKRTVDRDWQMAKAWLLVRLNADAASPDGGTEPISPEGGSEQR